MDERLHRLGRSRGRPIWKVGGVVLVLSLLLGACGVTEGGVSEERSGSNAPSEPPTTTTEPPTTTTTPTPENPVFGQTYEWEDGLAVTVGPPPHRSHRRNSQPQMKHLRMYPSRYKS
jgi:hypothetical protein